jgi:hypothetical protein
MFLFLSFVCGFLVPVRHHDGRKCSIEKMCAQRLIAALTREHGGWEQAEGLITAVRAEPEQGT